MNKEKCKNVDMKTGMRDCWKSLCLKDHTWRFKEIHNQPERSKREDLDCCKEVKNLEYLYDRYETYVMEHDQKSSDIIKDILNKSKMRCSEHCGNTVRDK